MSLASPISPRSVPLLVASLDLQLVRLIRGAIAANGGGPRPVPTGGASGGDSGGSREGSPRLEGPRLRFRPEPHFLPRDVHRPEPDIASRAFDGEGKVQLPPPASGPLPAPWQTLLREKVWNRPIEAPVAAEAPALAGEAARAYRPRLEAGGLLEAFV